jgi:hypothetical protein
MPRYRWTIELEAEDAEDADRQIAECVLAMDGYISERVEQLDEDGN